MASSLVGLALAHQQDGQENSVSHDRIIPLEAPVGDPRWRGWRAYQVDEQAEEARIELESPHGMDPDDYQELRLALEQIVAGSPPEQAKAGQLFLKSLDENASFRSICLTEGADPNRAKANLVRLMERARKELAP